MRFVLFLGSGFSRSYILGSRHLDGAILLAIGILILIGWGIVAARHWNNIIETNPRLGYFVCDICLLAPGCIIAGLGLLGVFGDAPWAPPTLLIAVGAAAFDLTHTFIYCAEIGFPEIRGKPPSQWAYGLVIIVTLAVLEWLAWREIQIETARQIPALIVWVLVPIGVLVTGAVAVGVLAARKKNRVSSTPP